LRFKKILAALDNSDYSNYGMEAAFAIGSAHRSEVTGCHVYAARLHESRFMDMEKGLPARYQSESILKRQKEVHEGLIEKGLGVIADSYMDRFEAGARAKGVRTRRRNREGKNWVELLREVSSGGYDLVCMGGLGKGAVELSVLGGVCERVARGIRKDLLVTKTGSFNGTIMVGIDGSPSSYGALRAALALSGVFGGEVEAVSVFDPYFHQVAFRNIAGALSEEAAKIFSFKEQEKLHDEIIDGGLAKLYQSYLDSAYKVAKAWGSEIKTTLLAGKAFNEMLKHAQKGPASFVVLGRFGLHRVSESEMGNTTENVLRSATTNVFIANPEIDVFEKKVGEQNGDVFEWTEGALKRMERVPAFVRGMARKAVQDYAREKGTKDITEELLDEVKKLFGM
jgi:nucleotide-binding universal stress UspA family protein